MNKILFIFAISLFLVSCAVQNRFLPDAAKTGLSPYGTYISAYTVSNKHVYGEFLGLKGDSLVILSPNGTYHYSVDTSSVKRYFIQYYKSRSYAILPITAISHGWWMVATVPINLVIAVVLKTKDMKDSRFHDLPFYIAAAYARYPQGLPAGYKSN